MHSATYVPLIISLGAVPGALSRYYLTLFFGRWLGIGFPYGTLFINITGAFLMGLFTTIASKLSIPIAVQMLVSVGFLGSYTTFSTYALDTSNLLRTRDYQAALLYWFGSPLLGFISIELGIFLAKMF
ncbi:chromosome condensation protein CrcB [Fischerella major NIES-592]|uniref:Fluoride-specific ion channel FluC n=2 Tax=Fischerella TaxID=1190 RepID=A0A1U7GV83_9CYAN|nr:MULTISPECIES: fluoride efflux transporter CrcB [Fischerella]OKH12043.1 chromosome condensation protein CrcB [Fischerella major NIES-592]PMB42659.1 chromosome condensation protein CrcB [Fischerella thermalis CCMEE 5330]BAU07454.1 CrcB protein [Fischerella sp. NIES-3754]BCX09784.1 MAG: putative fluoride ion transporter CrcB 1 [Fischerella sp.]